MTSTAPSSAPSLFLERVAALSPACRVDRGAVDRPCHLFRRDHGTYYVCVGDDALLVAERLLGSRHSLQMVPSTRTVARRLGGSCGGDGDGDVNLRSTTTQTTTTPYLVLKPRQLTAVVLALLAEQQSVHLYDATAASSASAASAGRRNSQLRLVARASPGSVAEILPFFEEASEERGASRQTIDDTVSLVIVERNVLSPFLSFLSLFCCLLL